VQYAPVRVANTPTVDSGLLLGASVRMISASAAGLAIALAYGLWTRTTTPAAVEAARANLESTAALSSPILESPEAEGRGYALASVSAKDIELPPAPRSVAPAKESRYALASVAPSAPVDSAKKWSRAVDVEAEDEESDEPPSIDERTAVYYIAAHAVYLPDGRRLEAHSGIGRQLDNPRFVSLKNRGSTPPNVYDLSLRERRFHGVQALRLTPVNGGKMFGRDGMLAHTYMLGPSGQSNGCVVFSDYQAFLDAYLSGAINRLVVVERLATTPNAKTGLLPVARTPS
jgi:hypothetical protein